MKFMQILLLVAVGACAVASEDELPPYHTHLQNYLRAKTVAMELSTPLIKPDKSYDWNLPSEKRDYIQLVGFLHDITERLVKDLKHSYDDIYYDVLNTSVPHTWTNSTGVLDNLRGFLSLADEKTHQVRLLIEHYCGAAVSGSFRRAKEGDEDCDLLVDLEIKKDKEKYRKEADSLIALGKSSALYVKEPYGPKAHNFDMISFLLNKKSELKELTLLTAEAKFHVKYPALNDSQS